jgi:alanine racemase
MGPTIAYISHRNFKHNLSLIRQAVGSRYIMAVVKANAYGHGDLELSRTAIEFGCEYLGVAFAEEGIRLREAGISHPILVFGAHQPTDLKTAYEFDLELTVTSKDQIDYLKTIHTSDSKRIPIHFKVDTGMNRVGFLYEKFESHFKHIFRDPKFEIKGVYSHLSSSDEADPHFTIKQIDKFKEICKLVKLYCKDDILFHLANSGAIMNHPDSYFDMVRPGIMIYGQPPSPKFAHEWDLKEVMSLRSKLGLIKFLKKNEPVSYGRRFYTKEDTNIGVIPAGYADGLNRKLTNNASVIINTIKYPLVGTVCMDMVMVDLGPDLKCKSGDEVVLYGQQGNEYISIREVSEDLHTIPYEVTCNVSARVNRYHV